MSVFNKRAKRSITAFDAPEINMFVFPRPPAVAQVVIWPRPTPRDPPKNVATAPLRRCRQYTFTGLETKRALFPRSPAVAKVIV